MTIIKQLYAIVKTLPQEQANEILTFAEFIRTQHLNANESIATNVKEFSRVSGLAIADWY